MVYPILELGRQILSFLATTESKPTSGRKMRLQGSGGRVAERPTQPILLILIPLILCAPVPTSQASFAAEVVVPTEKDLGKLLSLVVPVK
jgi:hypothetical protein